MKFYANNWRTTQQKEKHMKATKVQKTNFVKISDKN